MNLNYSQFAHRRFHAKDSESDVKRYIEELLTEEDSIWYQRGKTSKKLYKELVPLVYYVKYRYGPKPSITFQLNEVEGDNIDGWVYENNSVIESVQITIAHYTKKEGDEDRRVINDRDYVPTGWVYDRVAELENRIE
jgi:hypothetical protein